MIQRISVRICVISGNKTLLVRRADGRVSILGKFELPGGRVQEAEQPEDAARRFLTQDIGLSETSSLTLDDVMTYVDGDDRTIHYAVIVYRLRLSGKQRSIHLSEHYDKYLWYSLGKIDDEAMTEVSRLVIGTSPGAGTTGDLQRAETLSDLAVIYTDGGSRGNPGPSAAGYIIMQGDRVIDQGGDFLGVTTNNQAEYHGVLLGLEAALAKGLTNIEMRIDSMLVVNQLNGMYHIKNRELWPVNERVRELLPHFQKVKFVHVPREMNRLADGIVNRVLDEVRQAGV